MFAARTRHDQSWATVSQAQAGLTEATQGWWMSDGLACTTEKGGGTEDDTAVVLIGFSGLTVPVADGARGAIVACKHTYGGERNGPSVPLLPCLSQTDTFHPPLPPQAPVQQDPHTATWPPPLTVPVARRPRRPVASPVLPGLLRHDRLLQPCSMHRPHQPSLKPSRVTRSKHRTTDAYARARLQLCMPLTACEVACEGSTYPWPHSPRLGPRPLPLLPLPIGPGGPLLPTKKAGTRRRVKASNVSCKMEDSQPEQGAWHSGCCPSRLRTTATAMKLLLSDGLTIPVAHRPRWPIVA